MQNYEIEIKKLNFQPAMSEETPCFKGLLHINRKKVAEVSNNGRGEMTRFHWLTPDLRSEYGKDEESIESVIYKHLDKVVAEKDKANATRRVQRKLQQGLYFTRVGSEGKWYVYNKLKTKEDWDKAREKLSKIDKVEKVLNDIPLEEAVGYFYEFKSDEN